MTSRKLCNPLTRDARTRRSVYLAERNIVIAGAETVFEQHPGVAALGVHAHYDSAGARKLVGFTIGDEGAAATVWRAFVESRHELHPRSVELAVFSDVFSCPERGAASLTRDQLATIAHADWRALVQGLVRGRRRRRRLSGGRPSDVSSATDPAYEQAVTAQQAAATLGLRIERGDKNGKHYALSADPFRSVFINSETPIEFAVRRD
jgi:hypothetical protein